jgi:hypothetical protein
MSSYDDGDEGPTEAQGPGTVPSAELPTSWRRRRLTPAELWVCRAAVSGKVADLINEYGATETHGSDSSDTDWSLRAEVIRDLLLAGDDARALGQKGLRINGATIVGQLDFEGTDIKCTLGLENCVFEAAPKFSRASIPHLDLTGSRLPGLQAAGISVAHDFVLTRLVSHGEVQVNDAKIEGALDCGGAKFINESGIALAFSGGVAKQAVMLGGGFVARGLVNLYRARIGILDSTGGTFINANKQALVAENATVDGPVWLGGGFRALGEVSFIGAQLARLDCRWGTFINPSGFSLTAQNATVRGPVLLSDGAKAHGQVNLSSAQVEGELWCSNGLFVNTRHHALVAQGIRVTGSVIMRGFTAHGGVSLYRAQLGLELECDGGTFTGERRAALECFQPQSEFR